MNFTTLVQAIVVFFNDNSRSGLSRSTNSGDTGVQEQTPDNHKY